jgi:DNA-binding transcriptional regulator YiaG
MPNIAKVLKEEISRIARHEAKVAVSPIRKPTIRLRRDVADLKVRLALMEKVNKQLQVVLTKIQAAQPAAPATESESKGWISGKGIRSLRKRLGLSQAEFAKLVGVSDQGVYQWESKPGMLKLRPATKGAVFAVRGIGAKEAKQRLAEMAKQAVKPTKKDKRRRRVS